MYIYTLVAVRYHTRKMHSQRKAEGGDEIQGSENKKQNYSEWHIIKGK